MIAPATTRRLQFGIDWVQVPVYLWLALIVLIPNLLLVAASFMSVAGGRIELDEDRNKVRGKEAKISLNTSGTQIWIVPTNEELIVARQTKQVLTGK